jgi:hypothetical protein
MYDDRLQPSEYVEIARTWRSGDTVELHLPKPLRLEPAPDDPRVTAILWGPLVLAADHGPRAEGRRNEGEPVPALVAAGRPLDEWLRPVAGRPGGFQASGVARVAEDPGAAPVDLPLAPFYRTHRRRYSVYMDLLTPEDFDTRAREVAAERERLATLEAATLLLVRPGDRAGEEAANYRSEPERNVTRTDGRAGRGGPGWFSYDMPVDPSASMALVVTYWNRPEREPPDGEFQILVDGTPIARFEPNGSVENFWDAQYAIPAGLLQGKTTITVRFQADGAQGRIAPVFGVRMIRAGG